MNNTETITAYEKFGIYGLITSLEDNGDSDINPRVKAYNLLKIGREFAKKSKSETLGYLPNIAFELSRHESIYRMAGLLYIELGNMEKALECLSYLHHYYQDQSIEPHEQYTLIERQLVNNYKEAEDIQNWIAEHQQNYHQQKILNNIKEYPSVMPTEDVTEQKTHFKRLYRRYGIETVISAIENDSRFNDRVKAVLMIRASRTIGSIAEEGPSVESLFANKALELDTSDTVVKNSYQAYMRAGDLNKLTQLKEKYPQVVAG